MNIEEIISRIKSTHVKNLACYIRSFAQICVWGTGAGSDMIAQDFENNKINIAFFIDNDSSKWGTIFHGKKVIAPNDIPQDMLVIIAVSPLYDIHEKLNKCNHRAYLYLDPVFVYYGGLREGHRDYIVNMLDSNSNKLNRVFALLEDNESKELYADLLVHRAVHDIYLVLKHYQPNQYFGNDLVLFAKGTIVDCGAFQGDTLKRYLSLSYSNTDNYYAFEADRSNFSVLKDFCMKQKLRNVYPLNNAVCDRDGKVLFRNYWDNIMGGGIINGTFEQMNCDIINAITLDSVMWDKQVDYIMADIEGAELMMLDGARKIIRRDMPVLAISAYHRLEDMWEIPLKIKDINSNYKIYFRHHMVNMSDTVCYALK